MLCSPLVTEMPGDPPTTADSRTTYKLGLAPADVDTSLEKYFSSVGGLTSQCDTLNRVVSSVCCERFGVGCSVKYDCDTLTVEPHDLMTLAAYRYPSDHKVPAYHMHHGSVLQDVLDFLRSLQLYGKSHGRLPIAYTSNHIVLDDEETKNRANKIVRGDPAFRFLGTLLPGVSKREGTRILLDYYASREGLLLTVAPVNEISLTLAIAEYRANLFSFEGKQLTGTGARHLFELREGEISPNISGCHALSIEEPLYFQYLLRHNRDQQE